MQNIILNNITEQEIGYIIGVFIGDGYSNYNKNDRHYKVEFYFNSIRDKPIMFYVSSLIRRMGLNHFIIKDKRFNSKKIKVNSKRFFNLVNK